jgi:hypothetical protein
MRSFNRIVFALGLSTVPVAVSALPFVPNVYLGVEAGQGTRDTPAIGKKDKGLDYGGYAGVELPSMPFGYLAVEANAGASGGKTSSVTGSSSAAVGTSATPNGTGVEPRAPASTSFPVSQSMVWPAMARRMPMSG